MKRIFIIVLVACLCCSFHISKPDWGFWGHRRINRVAVFSLPPDMIIFFKKHIEFITEHAVDPDKRRYATKFEGSRHFIDIDHWGTYPFPEVPRDWTEALAKYTDLYCITAQLDTIHFCGNDIVSKNGKTVFYKGENPQVASMWPEAGMDWESYTDFFREYLQPQYYEEEWSLPVSLIKQRLGMRVKGEKIIAVDRFSEYGIVPYHLLQMQNRLTTAFRQRDAKLILRLATEMGHYVGDASVPLHTTKNYNGQLTNQVGIHAFWESRIPELFADREYDLFTGKADYIDNPKEYFWEIVLTSHRLVDSVLSIEKRLSRTFPEDQQYCFDERLNRTIRTQCEAYARAYQEAMNGMVENRMRSTIHAVASCWYTAWVDAGQPDLGRIDDARFTKKELERLRALEAQTDNPDFKIRKHEN